MPDFTEVNWLAVLIAAAAAVVIGFIWYMPAVFGRRWAAGAGRDLPTNPADVSPLTYVGSILIALLSAYVLALFVGGAGLETGLVVAALIWVGFVATTTFNVVLYEGRTVEYWLINSGYVLVTLLVMGTILGLMPRTM